MSLRLAVRGSILSVKQAEEFAALFPKLKFELIKLESFGDKHQEIFLTDPDLPEDFFTRELDEELLQGKADLALHSAKDLPYPLPPGLSLFCLTQGADPRDALVSREGLTLEELPAGAKVAASSKARTEQLRSLRPDLEIVPIRGTIEERIAKIDAGYADAVVIAYCALLRLGLEHRVSTILPFKTHPLQGHLALIGRSCDLELKALFAPQDIAHTFGKVTLAGFGPGSPDLITVRALKALEQAQVIFYDALTDADFLRQFKAEKVFVGKRAGKHACAQIEINELMYQAAGRGLRVVRLKGGDPMLFAHGYEEIEYLERRLIQVEVIPGVTAASALSAASKAPLTHRGLSSSVAFAAGHDLTQKVPSADTLYYYMAGLHTRALALKLLRQGLAPYTAVLLGINLTKPDQRLIKTNLRELSLSLMISHDPILIMIGKTAVFAQNTGLTLAAGTRPVLQAVHQPLIKILPLKPEAGALPKADYFIFTSVHGVELACAYFAHAALARGRIIAVGRATAAALRLRQLNPCFVPQDECARGIVDYFKVNQLPAASIALLRALHPAAGLHEGLAALGHQVIEVPLYDTIQNPEAQALDLAPFSKIYLGSPSGVKSFASLYKKFPLNTLLTARGDTTLAALQEQLNAKI